MAKALAYDRANQQVLTIDTINNRIDNLGAALATADQTAAFPLRSQDVVAVYHGDPHMLYRDTLGDVRLAVYSSGAWVNVAGFTPITSATGTLTPMALVVDQTYFVAIVQLSNSTASDGTIAKRSADGVTWDAAVSLLTPIQPTTSQGGDVIAWRNALFFGTAAGIGYYIPSTNAFGAAYDIGSDAGLPVPATSAGNFVFWNGTLYFATYESVPALYALDHAWTIASPTTPPAWTKMVTTGILTVGTVTISGDGATSLLFVNKAEDLCLFYSGQLGTKLLRMRAADFPNFTSLTFSDVTANFLPGAIANGVDLGFTLYVDDRRSSNELQSILINTPLDTVLASWDGEGAVTIRTTFVGTLLMAPNSRFGALRTFTDLQPACYVSSTSQPFPGRLVINYVVRDSAARNVDIFGEYSLDGDTWSAMNQGDGDDGHEQLVSSLVGTAHVFFWDAWQDLDGDFDSVMTRIVARISSV